MFLRQTKNLQKFFTKQTSFVRQISCSPVCHGKDFVPPDDEHPISRTIRILKDDIKRPAMKMKRFYDQNLRNKQATSVADSDTIDDFISDPRDAFQSHCDILVIGGGAMGSSVAYWLKKKAREGLNVVVIEKDPTYATASTPLSVGGLRQQFSIEENVLMSLYGAEFLRTIKEELGDDVDVHFNPYGYLMLASDEGAETLIANSQMQNEMGARNEILTGRQIKEKFPWINTDEIAVGCHGLEKEGWFDPWSLLFAYKKRAIEYGAHYTTAEVVGFQIRRDETMMSPHATMGNYQHLDKVTVKLPNGETRNIKFAMCVLAAGAESGKIARMANIGTGIDVLSVALPVEPRKRFVYCFKCQDDSGPGLNTPLTIDPSNTYFRRDGLGGNYIGGKSPCAHEEPNCDNLDVDYDFFDTHVWPHLAKRVPAFEAIKVNGAWAGFYEMNTFDENGIIGPHPYYQNLFFATGFSGHGIQQSPAVGRAISEIIMDSRFTTIDLTRLGFDRIIVNQPMYETNIV